MAGPGSIGGERAEAPTSGRVETQLPPSPFYHRQPAVNPQNPPTPNVPQHPPRRRGPARRAMAGSVLTPWYPVFVGRSDGVAEVVNKGQKLKNAPTKEQLSRTLNDKGVADYYRELDESEPKHQDWRKKLGGMLVRELGGPENQHKIANSILLSLPEHYRLYEHIKSKVDNEKNPNKNHSGGGHDRQDAYLYGHPRGPKKRFRSPNDFFPHLLWLAKGDSTDHGDCTCKLCCPESLEEKSSGKVKDETPAGSPAAQGRVVGTNPIVQIPVRLPKTNATPVQPPPAAVPVPAPAPALANVAPVPQAVPLRPTPLPQPRNTDQQVDEKYNKFLYRQGEVVWFRRDIAWGLGLILRRWLQPNQPAARFYQVQPLSFPSHNPPVSIIESDTELRPWLVWSAPPHTSKYLENNPMRYDQVDWQGMVQGRYRTAADNENINPEVDASILAAKGVDGTFTPFECVRGPNEERHWNGIFLGGEKIWNGEPVRIRIGANKDNEVMVVTDIIERLVPNTMQGENQPARRPAITFVGDIYTQSTVGVTDLGTPPELPSDHALPMRMREDMHWRNNLTLHTTRTLSYWRLVAVQQKLDVADIKGRWYEPSILSAEDFHASVSKGNLPPPKWMNARGDASMTTPGTGIRFEHRIQAFGPAVPPTAAIVDAFNPPPPSLPQTAAPAAHHIVQTANGTATHPIDLDFHQEPGLGDLSEFMNLDGIGPEWLGAHGGDGSEFHFS